MTIRVVVADDEELLRTGFRLVIDSWDDLAVVGEAGDGRQAVQVIGRTRPDVVLMDIRMPGMDGIEATRQIVASGSVARVLMLTTFDEDDHVLAALRAGASGFLLKEMESAELVAAIRATVRGDTLLAPGLTSRLLKRFLRTAPDGRTTPPALTRLSAREIEVLTLIGQALSNAEIARRLSLSEATVKRHVAAVLRKLELRDRVQAVVAAYDHGLVRPRGS
ncbi:DNA-binding response regulator [Streptomyces albiflavescens]|uniref:DNA-binding response regulator n=1 Tax=Streptomyces albiflavescens TaxID=1623582 RepID=A0A917Y3X2_9ACTN|nr:response regulator transcription factor [Streptomyces albiflavescens]GGN64541.1 DNA-binding response regulator [Streptomyces albiflavescens]